MPIGSGFLVPEDAAAGVGAGAGVGVGGVGVGSVLAAGVGSVLAAGVDGGGSVVVVVSFGLGAGPGVGVGGVGGGPASGFTGSSCSGFFASGVGGGGSTEGVGGGVFFAKVSAMAGARKWLGGGSATPLAERALIVCSE